MATIFLLLGFTKQGKKGSFFAALQREIFSERRAVVSRERRQRKEEEEEEEDIYI